MGGDPRVRGGVVVRASGYERAAADWYVEPAWVVDALLAVESFDGRSWDPCCGAGNIPRIMALWGQHCVGSDIADRGYGQPADFFSTECADIHNIISNPPYRLIEPFIRHALTKATYKVAILARLALLEGQKRRTLLQTTPLARVWVSSRRVSMPPGDTDVPAKGGSIAYAWFVFEHGHSGSPVIGWLP